MNRLDSFTLKLDRLLFPFSIRFNMTTCDVFESLFLGTFPLTSMSTLHNQLSSLDEGLKYVLPLTRRWGCLPTSNTKDISTILSSKDLTLHSPFQFSPYYTRTLHHLTPNVTKWFRVLTVMEDKRRGIGCPSIPMERTSFEVLCRDPEIGFLSWVPMTIVPKGVPSRIGLVKILFRI